MANTAKAISELTACTNPQLTDYLLISSNTGGNTQSRLVTVDHIFSNSSANVVSCAVLKITENTTPSDNTTPPRAVNNSIWSDGDYIYYYNGTTIKRAALSDF